MARSHGDTRPRGLTRIGRHEVASEAPTTTVLAVARRMAEEDVGYVVVVDGARPVGIFTDRDLVLRVVAEGKDPATTSLSDVMSAPLHVLPEGADRHEAAARLRERQVRRLPLVDGDGRLVGLVTVEDLWADVGRIGAELAHAIAPFPVSHFGG
jgi:CBS domain-containing protein